MEKVIKKYNSFLEQEIEDKKYWKNLSGEKKLKILEYIRLQYWTLNNNIPMKFEKVFKVTERN